MIDDDVYAFAQLVWFTGFMLLLALGALSALLRAKR